MSVYQQGVELLEAELERLKELKIADTRQEERIKAALEDLKKKAAAAEEE